jgi:signal transduction histidine kinase
LPDVLGDAGRLTQVLLNLVRNAIEVSPPGGTVTLTTRMETSYYVAGANGREQFLSLDVCDQGAGIAPENLGRIFSPFFTTKDGGTGLGLAISQRIITEHGGVLRVKAEPDSGAIFTVTLPVDRGNNHV